MDENKVERQIQRASKLKRMLSFLIDNLNISIVCLLILSLLNSYGLVAFNMETLSEPGAKLDSFTSNLINILIMAVTLSYYFLQEGPMQGYTIGKRITKTRAIHKSGNVIDAENAFFRSLCRLIPLEMFSIFFSSNNDCWHDWLTGTIVVDEKVADELL